MKRRTFLETAPWVVFVTGCLSSAEANTQQSVSETLEAPPVPPTDLEPESTQEPVPTPTPEPTPGPTVTPTPEPTPPNTPEPSDWWDPDDPQGSIERYVATNEPTFRTRWRYVLGWDRYKGIRFGGVVPQIVKFDFVVDEDHNAIDQYVLERWQYTVYRIGGEYEYLSEYSELYTRGNSGIFRVGPNVERVFLLDNTAAGIAGEYFRGESVTVAGTFELYNH